MGRALVALIGVALVLAAGRASAADVPQASFSWDMAPRFGFDIDRDGRIEIENTAEYVHARTGPCPDVCPAPRFEVELIAHPSPVELGLPDTFLSYEWRLDGPTGPSSHHDLDPRFNTRLAEGVHSVDLRVQVRLPWGRVTQRSRGEIVVEDLLVVALGDSYASGEGSPDVPADGDVDPLWADASDPAVESEHAAAHRSTAGWPVRVALALEDRSNHTSVTFVNLTASGARIDRGLLGERTQPPLPAQLDQAIDVVHERTVDVLLVQVGGNDVGFSRLIRALVDADPQLDPVCYEVMLANAWEAVATGAWGRDVSVTFDPPFDIGCEPGVRVPSVLPGLEGLPDAFARLQRALEALDVERVLLVEYPDPTGSPGPEGLCQEIVGDVTPPFGFHEVDEEEQQAGVERLLKPLNATLERVAADAGWGYIGGVSEAFAAGHGYCAPWPDYGYPDGFDRSPLLFDRRLDVLSGWYRAPGRFGTPRLRNTEGVSWYRTAGQSAALQGPVPRFLTAGTLHPNEQGHFAIAEMVLAALEPDPASSD